MTISWENLRGIPFIFIKTVKKYRVVMGFMYFFLFLLEYVLFTHTVYCELFLIINHLYIFKFFYDLFLFFFFFFIGQVGLHYSDDQLNDMSLESFALRLEKCKHFLNIANRVRPPSLNSSDTVSLKILKYELETYINYYDSKG